MSVAPLKRLISETDFSQTITKVIREHPSNIIGSILIPKYVQCVQCGVVPGDNPLSRMANGNSERCIGCNTFFSRCVGQEAEAVHWVRTGEWLNSVPVAAITDEEILVKFRSRARQINRRPRAAIPAWSPQVDEHDLMILYNRHGRRCQFSGLMANVYNGSGTMPFWAASVDHRVPVNGGRARALYTVNNLQIMISVFNSVKANNTDANLREWYDRFLASL